MKLDRYSGLTAVIPALVAGIQPSANAGASRELDPGHKARDDLLRLEERFHLSRKDPKWDSPNPRRRTARSAS